MFFNAKIQSKINLITYQELQRSDATQSSPNVGCQDVLTAEQRERRMREVEAEVAQLVGWGSEEARFGAVEKGFG